VRGSHHAASPVDGRASKEGEAEERRIAVSGSQGKEEKAKAGSKAGEVSIKDHERGQSKYRYGEENSRAEEYEEKQEEEGSRVEESKQASKVTRTSDKN
jgi:hypothetical protein